MALNFQFIALGPEHTATRPSPVVACVADSMAGAPIKHPIPYL